jgi:hypothetical protein
MSQDIEMTFWPEMPLRAPDGALTPVDLDATIVIAHSDKRQAAPTWKPHPR